jgi:hypothetical protein
VSKQYTQPVQELTLCSITGPNYCPPSKKASREEVAATLVTAIPMNAGSTYTYSLRTLEAFDTLKN